MLKKMLYFALLAMVFTTNSNFTSKSEQPAPYWNYDYDRGYNQSYDLGTAGNSALFASRYSTAINNDRFDLAEGMLDGYNAGRSNGPNSSPGQGGGNPTNESGCKIVIDDQDLVDDLNFLGIGCYVNFN